MLKTSQSNVSRGTIKKSGSAIVSRGTITLCGFLLFHVKQAKIAGRVIVSRETKKALNKVFLQEKALFI